MLPIRAYIDTTHCPCCLLQFHTRTRVVAHLHKKNAFCANYILSKFNVLDSDITRSLEVTERERVRSVKLGKAPDFVGNDVCYRIVGPPPCNLPDDPKHKFRRKHII